MITARVALRGTLYACLCIALLLPGGAPFGAAPAGAEPADAAAASPSYLVRALTLLKDADYAEKAEIVKRLAQSRSQATVTALQALLDGRLYTRRRDGRVFMVEEHGETFALMDPGSGAAAGNAPQEEFDKIVINNALRVVLQGVLAQFALGNANPSERLAAVQQILHSVQDERGGNNAAVGLELLRIQLTKEHNPEVRRAIQTAVALIGLSSRAPVERLAAIKELRSSLNFDVHSKLAGLTDPAQEADPTVRRAAGEALARMEGWRTFYGGVETLFFGLSLGSVLVLAAIGLAITFGVMGVINMAHGELIMLGAYTSYVLQLLIPNAIGLSTVLAVPVAFLVCGAIGFVIERSVVRFLYGRPLETLLATFGISLVLQQLVRDIFSANNRPVASPTWMSGSLVINEALSITYNRLVVLLFTLTVFVLLQIFIGRTTLGLQIRAVAQNRSMARTMGVRTGWVDAMSFALGSGVAGIAGVALSQLTNVGPNLGQSYIVDSFMVVVFGGVGNLWGTLIGGMTLGVINKILEPYAGAVLGKIVVLLCLISFIQRSPLGLFPQRGRVAES